MKMDGSTKFELHYYLADGTHAIDALVRNRCENEALLIAKEILIELGVDIQILNTLPTEGGFREWWTALGQHSKQLTVVGIFLFGTLTAIFNRIPVIHPSQEKNYDLNNRKLELEIKLLEEKVNTGEITLDTAIKTLTDHIDTSLKVTKHKSNFYDILTKYENVSSISATTYVDDKKVTSTEVDRTKFKDFVLKSNELPTELVDEAVLEIIAPVLKGKGYKWRGIYKNEPIPFTMKDSIFIDSIIKGDTTFHSDYFIECELEIKRKINEVGVPVNYDYTVNTVLGKITGGQVVETEQGKKLKRIKKDIGNQGKFDF
jgi:hypothetical protein